MSELFEIPKGALEDLIALLWSEKFAVFGPVATDGGIAFGEVHEASDLPIKQRDVQAPGRYRLGDGVVEGEVFGVVNGAGSLKPFFFAPEETLFEVHRNRRSLRIEETAPAVRRLAFIGVRACDLAALAIQDRIFLHDRFRDTHYEARRKDTILVAVNCTRSAPTCFCASMKTGPEATRGFDLSLTEMDQHFIVRSGSPQGNTIIEKLRLKAAGEGEAAAAHARTSACAATMQRRLDTSDLPHLLYEEAENPRWNDVATRCLSCTNCTMVCPTCFCTTVEDSSDLTGAKTSRAQRWDSCFTMDFSYIHGGSVRPSGRSRYRQWMTHKLATWWDQFGTTGCVGCGRCITWCPVGIDITEEVAAIRSTEPQ